MVEIVPASNSSRADPSGEEADGGITVERREKYSAVCKWLIPSFSKLKQRTTRCLWSKYFEVGGYDCRLLVYPAGDSQALPGYISIYLQVTDPKNATGKWDCFASYRLCVANHADDTKSISRDSWHRFSAKRKSHGWCDFAQSSVVLESNSGFAVNDTILVTADILVLSEQTQFSRENELSASASSAGAEVLSGKFTWKVRNFGLFREMIKTQKIMSPAFSAGECSLRLSVYQSAVSGIDYLSMCLESKDTDKAGNADRSCWCLFRMSVLTQIQGGRHMHRDSYGRFAADSKTGDNTSLGWNDFMSVSAFTDPEAGYLVDNAAIFSASFHIIKESSTFNRSVERGLSKSRNRMKNGPGDAFQGKFIWKIEHFTRLKELLKKRKITGLCIKSRRFQVGSRDCRLIVYPRGQSQPPNHLSMFLEVTDPSASADWSCFVSHRLSVVNQRSEDKSVAKESQNRYSKQAKDWGWREFVTLTSLFDLDAGFLVNDCVVFAAEVLVLRETSELKAHQASPKQFQLEHSSSSAAAADDVSPQLRFSWKIENFVAFKEIMETRKIFSKYFSVEGCDLRIGVYESFDTLCIYLESDAFGGGLERNFWVKYRIAVLNQKYPERTEWKESSICTKTWNNSVLQFMKVTEMVDPDAGYVRGDGLLLACDVLDCQPWFDFADLEVFASESEAESISTDPEELLDSDDSDALTPEEEDTFRSLLREAGLHFVGNEGSVGLDVRNLQQVLSNKMQMDSDAAASFVAGLRMYMDDDAYKIKRLLQPGYAGADGSEPGMCLFDLLMGIEVLQTPLLDLLLDMLLQLCHQQPKARPVVPRVRRQPFSSSLDTSASLAAAYSRFALEGREDNECASSSAAVSSLEPFTFGLPSARSGPPVVTGNDSSSSGTTTPQETLTGHEGTPEARGPQEAAVDAGDLLPPLYAGRSNGRAVGNSSREKADDLLVVAFRWLATADRFAPHSQRARSRLPSSAVAKVQTLLTELPRHLQPQLVMLVPKLIDPLEHTSAAGVLLTRLADANREGAEPERELRLPVLAALGMLRIDPAAAEKVLKTALEALPTLLEPELPPAVGLILKLANEAPGLRATAVHTVRTRVKSRSDVSHGTLDAVRLAVTQHPDVAIAMLADIDMECRNMKPATELNGETRNGLGDAPRSCLHLADLEVLLDLLGNPELNAETIRIVERAITRGLLSDMEVAMALEQRRMRGLSTLPEAQKCFLSEDGASHPSAYSSGHDSAATPSAAEHQPFAVADDSENVLALAESLAVSKSHKARAFAASLYKTVFRVNSEEGKRGRMLRGLISRAAVSSNLPLTQTSKERAAPGSAPPGRSAPMPPNGRHAQNNRSHRPASAIVREADEGAAAPAEGRQEMDVTTPEGLLLTLVSQYTSAARPAVVLMMLEAQSANAQAVMLRKRVQELENGQEKVLKEARTAAARHKVEADVFAERLSVAESQVAQLRGDHSAEAAGFASTKKELEEKVRNLERELEWVRGEREEERTAMALERRETAARMKELEATSNRLKSARRDDLKRVTRERTQAVDRCKELEGSHNRLEDEIKRLKGLVVTSTATQDSLVTRLEEQERQAKATLRQREEKAEEHEKCIRELETSLKERQGYAASIEAQLMEEVTRTAPLYGSNLDRLTASQLEGLARIHEAGVKRARAMMAQRRSEESAAATAVAAANAVTGSVGPPPRPLQTRGSPGATAPIPQRSASSLGSLDSLMSLGLDPPMSSAIRGLDRAPGAAQLASARSLERPGMKFGDQAGHLQRSMTPGIASYYNNSNGQNGGFSQANAALPNGFPNGLLSGTGLLNGQHPSANGTHRLW